MIKAALRPVLGPIDRALFGALRGQYPKVLARELGGCRSLLDVGCGAASPLAWFPSRPPYTVGVDAFVPALQKSKAARIHDAYTAMDALRLGDGFPGRPFDCVLALDVIEHLAKPDAARLLTLMEQLARRKVILLTPNGFLAQPASGGNAFQVHRSGWSVGEMRARGFRVIGVDGWKALRGTYGVIRGRPPMIWERLSRITQPIVERHPEWAFELLCVRDLREPAVEEGHVAAHE